MASGIGIAPTRPCPASPAAMAQAIRRGFDRLQGFAGELRGELVARYRPKPCVVSPITPVIAAHAGLGAWGVFYQIEDGTNGGAQRYD